MVLNIQVKIASTSSGTGIPLARRLVALGEHDTRQQLFKRMARLFKYRAVVMLGCSNPVQVDAAGDGMTKGYHLVGGKLHD